MPPVAADDAMLLDAPEHASARGRGIMLSVEDMAHAIGLTLGSTGSPVDPCANAYEFAKEYGLKFDGNRLTGPGGLDGDYKHLRDVYQDTALFLILMAGAQTGKSALLITHLVRTCLAEAYGKAIGYYFPDKHLPIAFSRGRLKPFVRSNPALAALLGKTMGDKQGQDATLTMTIAETTLHIMTILGKTATEGLPLKGVYFDEVRKMLLGDIERAQERYSAQRDPINVKVSTAKYPESDIHHWFLQGDQRFFHTACDCIGAGVVLAESFPDCIADLRSCSPLLKRKIEHAYHLAGIPNLGMTEVERQMYPPAAYICPKCGKILVDPRDGWWEPRANAYAHSYQFTQMLSVSYPAGRALQKFEENVDYQEIMNSMLGLPYVDKDKMPIQAEHINACVNKDLKWGRHIPNSDRRRLLPNCAMGIDVQAGYGICVIKHRPPRGGKPRVVHLEVLKNPEDQDLTWWYRAGELMEEYDVRAAVVDSAPEFNESMIFVQAFGGRAWLADFSLGDSSKAFIEWADKQLANESKQRGESAVRYRVSAHRVRALHWSLMKWKNRGIEIPDLDALIQTLPNVKGKPVFSAHLRNGVPAPTAVGRILQDHLTRFVFRDVLEDDPQKARLGLMKHVAEHVGSSPDFALANLYADMALERCPSASGVRGLGG